MFVVTNFANVMIDDSTTATDIVGQVEFATFGEAQNYCTDLAKVATGFSSLWSAITKQGERNSLWVEYADGAVSSVEWHIREIVSPIV